jgi:Lipopolysaccharide kinase (Kdo/WaaP) family
MSSPIELIARVWRGGQWSWVAPKYRHELPADLELRVMDWKSSDRLHEKQGRSTCRVHIPTPSGPLAVYLKRHYRLPKTAGLAAAFDPGRRHSPAGVEWERLAIARDLGISVPETVAAGELLGRFGQFQSYLLIRELTGQEALNEALPRIKAAMSTSEFSDWKRCLVDAMASMVAQMHQARAFHKDLYLCHFFVSSRDSARPGTSPTLIDLHRLGIHRLSAPWYRWKDLGQLLFSTAGVPGISRRDRLRFWVAYRRRLGRSPRSRERLAVVWRARRYLAHSRSGASFDSV